MTTRRVTVNLPSDLLDAAREVSGKGITATIIDGLEHLRRHRFYERALALRRKVKLKIDLEESRGRRRRWYRGLARCTRRCAFASDLAPLLDKLHAA